MLRAAILLCVLTACARHGGGAGAPCDAIGARFVSLARADLDKAKDLDGELRAGVDGLIAPMRDGLVRACREDAWSSDARDCFASAPDVRAMQACYARLTAPQRAALDQAAAGGSGSN